MLKNLLSLNDQEQKCLEYCLALHNKIISAQNGSDKIFEELQKAPNSAIVKIGTSNEIIESYCKRPEMQDSLQERLQHIDILPQPNINNFDLLRGVFFYNHISGVTPTNEPLPYDTLSVFLEAIRHGSFHATFLLQKHHLEQIQDTLDKKNPVNFSLLFSVLTRAETAAQLHGTPGFLLCVTAYIMAAKYYLSLHDTLVAKTAFQTGLKNLYVAQILEQHSENAINNAYCGEGIKASNIFGLTNFDELIDAFLKNYSDYLDSAALDLAHQQAEETANLWLATHSQITATQKCTFKVTP